MLDEMAGLVSPKKAPSGVLPPASTDAAILKEGKNLAEAPSAPTETLTDLSRKQAEYAEELADLGYYEEKRAQDLAVLETPEPAVDLSKRFKIDGELRIDNNDTSNHHAVDPERKRIQFPDDRLRLRARIYMDYNLDNNWHAIGMLESEKALHGDDSMNGTIDLDRYYLKGAVGKVMVMAGAFGKTLAEGNIYDSRFKGIQVAYGDHHPWYYEGAFGKVNEADEVTALTAIYQKGRAQTLFRGLRVPHGWGQQPGTSACLVMRCLLVAGGVWEPSIFWDTMKQSPAAAAVAFSLSRGEENSWEKGNRLYLCQVLLPAAGNLRGTYHEWGG